MVPRKRLLYYLPLNIMHKAVASLFTSSCLRLPSKLLRISILTLKMLNLGLLRHFTNFSGEGMGNFDTLIFFILIFIKLICTKKKKKMLIVSFLSKSTLAFTWTQHKITNNIISFTHLTLWCSVCIQDILGGKKHFFSNTVVSAQYSGLCLIFHMKGKWKNVLLPDFWGEKFWEKISLSSSWTVCWLQMAHHQWVI